MEEKKQILMIDDEPNFIEMTKFNLEHAGFSVISALTGEEGIKKAHLLPDLILLDVLMPGMDGHEVCRRLKKDEVTKSIPIIMLTAKDETLEKVEAFKLGIADYICKLSPFLEILVRIKAVLRQSSLAASPSLEEEKNKKITQLEKIIADRNINIAFQSIVTLSHKSLIGYEVLLAGPQGTEFEDVHLLFHWAAKANKSFELDDIYRNLTLKNAGFLSPDQFLFLSADPNIIDSEHFKSLNFIRQSTIKPSQICLELSERDCIKNFAKLSQAASYFKSTGFKVIIDDVGEGYSNLETIAELKPDFIKLATSLTKQVNVDTEKQKLIQLVVDLAERLNTYIIANGIEGEEEYKTLLALGVKYGQGALFGSPIKV
jgi:EAL domain-containing protein (putative c-di-GMP-specific phosphodiesterase class I)